MRFFANAVVAALCLTLLSACGGDSDSSGRQNISKEPLAFRSLKSCPIINNTIYIGTQPLGPNIVKEKCKVSTPKLIDSREFALECISD